MRRYAFHDQMTPCGEQGCPTPCCCLSTASHLIPTMQPLLNPWCSDTPSLVPLSSTVALTTTRGLWVQVPEPVSLEVPMLGGKRFDVLSSLHLVGTRAAAAQVVVQLGQAIPPPILGFVMVRAMTDIQLDHCADVVREFAASGRLPPEGAWERLKLQGERSGSLGSLQDLRAAIASSASALFADRLRRYASPAAADIAVLQERRSHHANKERASGHQLGLVDAVRVRLGEKRALMAIEAEILDGLQSREDDSEPLVEDLVLTTAGVDMEHGHSAEF